LTFTWLERRRQRQELPDAIAAVARKLRDRPVFEAAAMEVAARFGARTVTVLRRRLHKPTPAPAEFDRPNAPYGAWLSAWEFAIFEVFFCLPESALEVVRQVAFGGYDWTQGNAIEVLCRWAAEGFERERTLRDLRYEMRRMRPEAIDYAVGPLLAQAKTNPLMDELIEELRSVPAFEQAYRDARDQATA
jgi:hypothetical protein